MFAIDNTTIVGIDLQEKMVKFLNDETLVGKVVKLLKSASILNVDTILTEQYPKGIGPTIPEIKAVGDFDIIEKSTFSLMKTEKFKQEFTEFNNVNVIIFGVETHICVLQTVCDFIKEGYNVFVVEDCCFSRGKKDHDCAIDLMRQLGARIVTFEIVLFEFLKGYNHPLFKDIQAFVK